MKNNSYELSYSFYFFLLCFIALNPGLILPALQKLLKILLLKKGSRTSCICCIRFSVILCVGFFHGLFLTLTSIMKCAKILFLELNSGPEVLLWHFWTSLGFWGVFFLVFFFPIFSALLSAGRNDIPH